MASAKKLDPEIEALIEQRFKSALADLRKAAPREVFNGDDALFLAWMAGFTAGVHVTRSDNDASATQIFARCRNLYDKLATIAGPPPPVGGS